MDKPTREQQLVMLRELTARTGVLHEAQVLQIKLWPHAVDPGLDDDHGSEALVDLEARAIKYVWKAQGRSPSFSPDRPYKARLAGLREAVTRFFGANWGLTVVLNDRVIYTSTATAQAPLVGSADLVAAAAGATAAIFGRKASRPKAKAISGKRTRGRTKRRKKPPARR